MPEPHSASAASASLGIQLLFVVALVVANAFFVAAEFALVSVRRTRIDQLAAEGSQSATILQSALRDLDRQIGAAQVGITVVSLLLGSTGEKVLEPMFLGILSTMGVPREVLNISRVGIAFVLAYLVMTSMHVILGEQLPKIIAIQKAETTGLLIVRPMMLFTRICSPLVWILTHSVNFLLRVLGVRAVNEHGQVHSPEELDLLFTQSHEGGELTETERDILHRVVKFSDLTAREVMVPRVEMMALPVEMPRRAFIELVYGQPHTRMPIYHGTMDEIVGVAHLKDLVRFAASLDGRNGVASTQGGAPGEIVNLMPLAREAARVPETITIDKMLVEFKRRRQQMAIVIDEYGGTAGIITMGDLLEQAFGDVHDEFDKPEPEIFTRPDGRIQMPGRTLITEINDRFSTGFADDESDTMAGLILGELGRPAVVGDEVQVNGVRLCVEAVERLRIMSISMLLPTHEAAADARGNGTARAE
ncbi:MAG TPA: hemolysin family protein [Abditibacteriaceae bacterium]|jgi:CBS domain containing-hemolysin-like protein